VGVLADGLFELLEEGLVGRVAGSQALLVQDVDDAAMSLLDQVADDFVVEVLDRFPLDGRKEEGSSVSCGSYKQGRTKVRWRPGQEASFAPPYSIIKSFGSKCTAVEKVYLGHC